ncbi:ribonuclease P/MRP protein subunit RPP40 [Blastomyces parvus]|uniref:Ribonuclease P/MRP protein subunit RPP40 n=1 Tax=Blastomyces parvus TaxID=2060905 RepID=A0A2B7WZ03_9EURO|nr:ribonuclease P/MRP protein subunit RPP40 [Blastomyces parvus]
MYEIDDPGLQKEKCYTTIGKLPPFVDPQQPPIKKSPFSSIAKHSFVHSTALVLPKEIYDSVWDSISSRIQTPQFAKVILPLSALLEHDFFNPYIKIGDILLISEGRSGVDNVYTLKDGVLRLELDKNSFERAGLDGKSIRTGGRKHVKERYAVEINLRLPSMLHGKKGFERIVWAFKNVLTTSVTWLFCDLTPSPTYSAEDAPIKRHHPQIIQCAPDVNVLGTIMVPPLHLSGLETDAGKEFLHETCDEIQEWLGLVVLDSPRVHVNDTIDPYLSRYAPPNQDECQPVELVRISWKGLLSSAWITQLFAATLRQFAPGPSKPDGWFALTSFALGREAVESKDGYTILFQPLNEGPTKDQPSKASTARERPQHQFICWEYVGGSSYI